MVRIAVVTGITEKGFKWRMEEPVLISPRLGQFEEGECYPEGYGNWRALTEAETARLIDRTLRGESSLDEPAIEEEKGEAEDNSGLVAAILTEIAKRHRLPAEGMSAGSYGTDIDNDVFMMHPFCWCDGDDCPWCAGDDVTDFGAPNFHYKPTDFRVWWYKYIPRDLKCSRRASSEELADLLKACLAAGRPAHSPS